MRLVRFARDRLQRSQTGITDENDVYSKLFWLKVEMYIIIMFVVVSLSASAIYFTEGEIVEFASIPEATLWSAKILLGGAHSIGTHSVLGEIITICTRFVALILLGLMINIIRGVVQNRYLEEGMKI